MTLKPGDRLVFDRKEGRASRSRVSTRNYSQWMGGSLSFDDTSLADILTNLERWYAVEIDAPEAWTRQVRMSFKLIRNESIEEILKAMSLVVEMDYVCAGRRITILPTEKFLKITLLCKKDPDFPAFTSGTQNPFRPFRPLPKLQTHA